MCHAIPTGELVGLLLFGLSDGWTRWLVEPDGSNALFDDGEPSSDEEETDDERRDGGGGRLLRSWFGALAELRRTAVTFQW